MTTLVPTASSCHSLRLPPTEKDDRLNLNVRTGSASTLYKSLVCTFGGLTIGLDLVDNTAEELVRSFHLKISSMKSRLLDKYLSGEFFYLDLIEKYWTRVDISLGEKRPKPRVFHEILTVNNCVYVFGGLIVNEKYDRYGNDEAERELVPCNDLWEFNLETKKWNLLHDGANYENDRAIPKPRYNHKMTTLSSLSFANRRDHFGIFIAGGKGHKSKALYDNFVFDLVAKKYVGSSPIDLIVDSKVNDQKYQNINSIVTSEDYKINVDYGSSVIVSFIKDSNNQHHHHYHNRSINKAALSDYSTSEGGESLVIYTRVDPSLDLSINPLISFKIGKSLKKGKVLPLHRKSPQDERPVSDNNSQSIARHTIPYNLRFPTGGLFGQNIVITGFLPNDNDISVFVYNKPTGKWSRLNFFCDHDYGSHKCWGGFAWQSHHKVVLLGNYLSSHTSSSIKYFTLMITVSLPITNILASLELEGGHYHCPDGTKVFFKDDTSSTDDNNRDKMSDDDVVYSSSDALSDGERRLGEEPKINSSVFHTSDKTPHAISFSEYVHYVAPKTKFTTIRSVFPPAAITLGRNAMDRYGDLISDFEFVSSNGDRIPVSMRILMERWGRYFIQLLARGYVNAVDKFENDQQVDIESIQNSSSISESLNSATKIQNKLKTSLSTAGGSSVSSSNSEVSINQNNSNKKANHLSSYHVTIPALSTKLDAKEPPKFRLPFQDSLTPNNSNTNVEREEEMKTKLTKSNVDGSKAEPESKIEKLRDVPGCNPEAYLQDPGSHKGSISSFSSNNSLLTSHLQNIPPQLPLPNEPIPCVPAASTSFRSSRKNSADLNSPRASLMYTLTALRNIPTSKSPRESPFGSPRASVSGQVSESTGTDLMSSTIPNLKHSSLGANRNSTHASTSLYSSPSDTTDSLPIKSTTNENITDQIFGNKKTLSTSSATSQETLISQDRRFSPLTSIQSKPTKSASTDIDNGNNEANENDVSDSLFNNPLLDFENIESGKFRMEPSLIPRKLYMPFPTSSIKAFCEYLYTGQVGNKWLLTPVTLDNLAIAKFLDIPLLYDLISEVLFGIIGRKESYIIREGNNLRQRYNELLKLTNSAQDSSFTFPLDEYEGFMDTIDDGFLDITLLKKSSAIHKDSSASAMSNRRNKLSLNSTSSFRYSISIDDINEKTLPIKEVPIDERLASANKRKDGEHSITANIHEESSDDSTDRTNSNSEEDADLELGYLDARDTLLINFGPRAKSIFDKPAADFHFQSALGSEEKDNYNEMETPKNLNLTLEQLVKPEAPLPSTSTIDLIYETATICRDIKLMLRATNVQNMHEVFKQSKFELDIAIEELENKYEEQQRSKANENLTVANEQPKQSTPVQATRNDSDADLNKIRSNMSSSSLSTLGLKSNDLEKSKSNPGFRNIGSFGPFKSKTDLRPSKNTNTPFDNNKELDKRITRLIKNDERLKLKTAKDEKLKRLQDQKLEKRQTDKPQLTTKKTLFQKYKDDSTSTLASESTDTKKKHHGFLHHIGNLKKKKETSANQGDEFPIESSKLSRKLSATGSISSANSKKSQGLRIKTGLFGKKRASG